MEAAVERRDNLCAFSSDIAEGIQRVQRVKALWGCLKVGGTLLGGGEVYLGYKSGTPILGNAHFVLTLQFLASNVELVPRAFALRLVLSAVRGPRIILQSVCGGQPC